VLGFHDGYTTKPVAVIALHQSLVYVQVKSDQVAVILATVLVQVHHIIGAIDIQNSPATISIDTVFPSILESQVPHTTNFRSDKSRVSACN
jgi:hypothetical protein